ncbi:MAG: RdgB/HAM1 family non-canonical purine NTP pyrophosphatase [Verrucomicrobia bacterium]|nr:RdgB/HAM1 family non-canonical purine NTP pyrophosphatase [Verrucomicrobiota bacterium]
MHHILLATRNRHKTGELAALLGADFQVEDLTAHPDFPEVDETGVTFLENATLKALAASRYFGGDLLVLADDSGLEVDALGGAPGVRSARFAGPGARDGDNTALLLARLENRTERAARFRCAIAIAQGGALAASFEGACEGCILDAPKGGEGFGYDPVFVPDGYTQTFAELPAEEKNRISHRARATQQALAWLRALP